MNPPKNLDLKKWDDNSKELCAILIGHIFAYWTLLSYKDMNYKTKDRIYLRQPHHSQIITILMLLGGDNKKSLFDYFSS